jgi:hypothetical protein
MNPRDRRRTVLQDFDRRQLRETVAVLLAMIALVALLAWCAPATSAELHPPLEVRFEAESLAREPGGPIVSLTAGTVVQGCRVGGSARVAEYDLASRTFRLLHPCTSLFRDGFEE